MITSIGALESAVEDARQAAQTAADSAGITIRLLDQVEEFSLVVALFERIWSSDVAQGPINTETLRAISKAGSYLAGAFDGDTLIGACIGFFAAPAQHALHSHIAGVDGSMRGRNVGFALKVHQRAWALEVGIREISWTFDPLISRNAHFNIVKLGAQPRSYHRNFYGLVTDVVNGADETDRMLVAWDLLSMRVARACHGVPATIEPSELGATGAQTILEASADNKPVTHTTTGAHVLVRIPADIESLRTSSPELASEWRAALRDSLGALMEGGARVLGFGSAHGYLLDTEVPA